MKGRTSQDTGAAWPHPAVGDREQSRMSAVISAQQLSPSTPKYIGAQGQLNKAATCWISKMWGTAPRGSDLLSEASHVLVIETLKSVKLALKMDKGSLDPSFSVWTMSLTMPIWKGCLEGYERSILKISWHVIDTWNMLISLVHNNNNNKADII